MAIASVAAPTLSGEVEISLFPQLIPGAALKACRVISKPPDKPTTLPTVVRSSPLTGATAVFPPQILLLLLRERSLVTLLSTVAQEVVVVVKVVVKAVVSSWSVLLILLATKATPLQLVLSTFPPQKVLRMMFAEEEEEEEEEVTRSPLKVVLKAVLIVERVVRVTAKRSRHCRHRPPSLEDEFLFLDHYFKSSTLLNIKKTHGIHLFI